MTVQRTEGTSPLDRLGSHYNRASLICPRCGYEDENGSWRAETSGDRVRYHHRCPSCDSIATRTLRLK